MNATNILKYEKELIEAGISAEQAAIHAKNMASCFENINSSNVIAINKIITQESHDLINDFLHILREENRALIFVLTITMTGIFFASVIIFLILLRYFL